MKLLGNTPEHEAGEVSVYTQTEALEESNILNVIRDGCKSIKKYLVTNLKYLAHQIHQNIIKHTYMRKST